MDCQYRHRLNAYHDAELGDAEAHELERHLETCMTCQAELEEIQAVSEAFAGLAASATSPAAMARAHAAADAASELIGSAAESRHVLFRVAGLLTAVAASVLLVGSAWLLEPPAAPTGIGAVVIGPTPAPAAEWERIAMTLDAGPLLMNPAEAPGRLALASAAYGPGDDMRVADWMIRNLSR